MQSCTVDDSNVAGRGGRAGILPCRAGPAVLRNHRLRCDSTGLRSSSKALVRRSTEVHRSGAAVALMAAGAPGFAVRAP